MMNHAHTPRTTTRILGVALFTLVASIAACSVNADETSPESADELRGGGGGVCGDGTCSRKESCSTCPADCGSCTSSGGGGTSTSSAPKEIGPGGGGAPTQISGAARVVWTGTRYVAFWEKGERTCAPASGLVNCTTTATKLMATEISASGSVGTSHTILSFTALTGRASSLTSLVALPMPTGFAVAWREKYIPNASDDIWYAMVDTNLALKSSQHFTTELGGVMTNATDVYLAGDGTNNVLMWEDNNPHQSWWFSRLNADGTRSAPQNVKNGLVNHHIDGGLAWDGKQFGWTYVSDNLGITQCWAADASGGGCGTVNGSSVCNCDFAQPPFQVMLTRFTIDGTVLGTTTLSDAPEMNSTAQLNPTVSSRYGGGFGVAWISTLRNGAPDITASAVDANGVETAATNAWLTTDGNTTAEANPRLARGASQQGYVLGWDAPASTTSSEFGVRVQQLDTGLSPVGASRELLPPPKLPYSPSNMGGCWGGQGSTWYPWTYPDASALWCKKDKWPVDIGVGTTNAFAAWGAMANTQLTISGTTYNVSAPVSYGNTFPL